MFSIDDNQQRQERILGSQTIISAGWSFADFTYTGDELSEQQQFDFNGNLLSFQLRSPGLDLGIGFGGSLTGIDDRSYFNVNGRIYNNFPLKRSPSIRISLPLQLTTDVTHASRNTVSNDFRQSSLSVGTGIATLVKLSNRFSAELKATPNYGFSFSQGSLFGGSLLKIDGDTRLLIHNVFGDYSLSIGYDYEYRNYDIDGDVNDYDFTAHTVTIGIGF